MTDASNIASRRQAFVESCLLVIEERARENGSLFGAAGKDDFSVDENVDKIGLDVIQKAF